MLVELNNSKLNYTGRIDRTNPYKPEFIYPATSLAFRFLGKQAVIKVENRKVCWDNYVGAIVDGEQKCWKLNDEGITEIILVEGEKETEHEILFFKRQDGSHEMILHELYLSEESILLDPPAKLNRRIEVYGDSVSAGEVSEAVDYIGKPDPEHNGEYSNSWYSYAWMTARKLNAEIHDIAQGGIPLLNGNGWVCPPGYPGMEFMWDKLHYHTHLRNIKIWDFEEYQPHVVIFAVGQNDSNPEDYMKENPHGLRADYWKYKYQQMIELVREKYPKAWIILTTTILQHDKGWDDAIEEVCKKVADQRVCHFLYKRNGSGTPGHIRIPEAEEMSDELAAFIEKLGTSVWEDGNE